ncbi:MAG: signal peptidase II [candidate division WOR-3 bacterium]|nr:MAG: signal peptidase II [candidate division WOR-3 bacterium]
MIFKKNIKPLVAFVLLAFLLDQISKFLIVHFLTPFESPTQIIGSLLRFKLTYNPYGVFSIPFGPSVLYYIFSVIGVIVLLYVSLSLHDRVGIIVFGFIIGGAIGNVVDRIRLNYVIDFIDMGIGNVRWFTYNLADAFITVGALFLLTRELIYKKKLT